MDRQEALRSYRAAFWLALGIAVFSIISFGGLALLQEGRRARYEIVLVSLHALLVLGWFALIAVQARLAMRGNLRNHRIIGRYSVFHVAALVLVSGIVTWNFVHEFGRVGTGVGDTFILTQFVLFYGLAIWMAKRRKIDWHLRFMLASALAMLSPAHGRFVELVGFERQDTIVVILLTFVVLPLAFDFLTRRKIHRATWIVIAILLAFFAASVAAFVQLEGF